MIAKVNFQYFLQIKIIRKRESRRQRCLLMKNITLRRRKNHKLFITICPGYSSRWVGQISEWNYFGNQIVRNTFDNEPFKSCFLKKKKPLNFILNRIEHHLIHITRAEEPILSQERLGICLFILSWCDYYHTITEITRSRLKTV